jgi:hypothetical protein
MHWYRLLWTCSLLVIIYGVNNFDFLKSRSNFRLILAFCFIVSISIGIDYIFFYLLAGMEFHPTTQENWTNVLSVFIFISCEAIGVQRLLRNKTDYWIWMLPAVVDLFLKGTIAFLVFNNHTWFVWDTLRALVLLILMYYDRVFTIKKTRRYQMHLKM